MQQQLLQLVLDFGGGDELLFVATTEIEDELQELLLHPQSR